MKTIKESPPKLNSYVLHFQIFFHFVMYRIRSKRQLDIQQIEQARVPAAACISVQTKESVLIRLFKGQWINTKQD